MQNQAEEEEEEEQEELKSAKRYPREGTPGKTVEEEAWNWRTGRLILEVPRKNGGGDPGQAPGKSASGDRNLRLELKNR